MSVCCVLLSGGADKEPDYRFAANAKQELMICDCVGVCVCVCVLCVLCVLACVCVCVVVCGMYVCSQQIVNGMKRDGPLNHNCPSLSFIISPLSYSLSPPSLCLFTVASRSTPWSRSSTTAHKSHHPFLINHVYKHRM